ncbi:ABC transporter ATP-binding protein [Cyanobium sp. NIES-981]|uniref:ABC transporter ATP-binding protein n=1 Tax=Cyanobium sp. NIES-981 TaxID=1851505 RepID=UPI0007DDE7EC|nr:ABC transporter ATP-binding protein [Cyanobium sp. NIES-981]SBO41910.1 Lipoprotein-releasing system ATP-binding protein LolD 1 [Cyanobium sp. NIES-981]
MLELRGIRYQPATATRPVLNSVDLQLAPGAIGLVAGRSGGGKTTLLELIGGLADPDRGTILWNGDPLKARQRRWLCGLVFQFPERHFLGLTVGQELRLGHRRLEQEKVAAVLELVGLAGVGPQQLPEQLSGGQQRRLALAVQLLRNPRVLLLDEPTAGLDWAVRDDIVGLLQALAEDRAVLVVTHEPELFHGQAASRWRLEDGHLVDLSPQATAPTGLLTMP